MMWQTYLQPTSLSEALDLLQQYAGQARLISGGTDVLVELQRGVQPTSTLIDITALPDLKYVRYNNDTIYLGALTTHNDVVASPTCIQYALPLAQACWEVGAPQIRTRATIAGNLITASPANDTIAPLMALNAEVVLVSASGERVVPLRDFYRGVRRTVRQPDELLREIRIPAMRADQRGLFLKLGLRQAQAISVINIAFVLTFNPADSSSVGSPPFGLFASAGQPGLRGPAANETVIDAQITLGCLAPTIVHARTVEAYLKGQRLDPQVCQEASRLANEDVSPIDDIRSSAAYRQATLANLVTHGLQRLATHAETTQWPPQPVLLETNATASPQQALSSFDSTISTTINGQSYQLTGATQKTLLNALR